MVLQDRFKDSPYKYPSPEKEEPRRNTVAKIAQRSSNPAVFSCDHESLADHVGGLAMEYFFLISVDSDSNTGLFTLWSVLRNDVLHVTWMFHLKTLPNAQTASLNDVSPCWSACPVKVTCSGWKHLSMAPDVPVQPPPPVGAPRPTLVCADLAGEWRRPSSTIGINWFYREGPPSLYSDHDGPSAGRAQ